MHVEPNHDVALHSHMGQIIANPLSGLLHNPMYLALVDVLLL